MMMRSSFLTVECQEDDVTHCSGNRLQTRSLKTSRRHSSCSFCRPSCSVSRPSCSFSCWISNLRSACGASPSRSSCCFLFPPTLRLADSGHTDRTSTSKLASSLLRLCPPLHLSAPSGNPCSSPALGCRDSSSGTHRCCRAARLGTPLDPSRDRCLSQTATAVLETLPLHPRQHLPPSRLLVTCLSTPSELARQLASAPPPVPAPAPVALQDPRRLSRQLALASSEV
mmetsp:Transcript_2712/g.6315  ORF Transcript_2712/g.6315 Transcript_2712/m.6315 type:complete len:227 (-) Transcript_2712:254-934(-)